MFLANLFRKENKIKPVVLVMYDGWGLAPPSHGNAITLAKTSTMDMLYEKFPHGELIAAGESVGLPAGEVGNSEVGHLTAGVGRVIYQSLKRINLSIEKGSFYENEIIEKAITSASENSSNLHIMGLVSSGNVHSNREHLYALLQACKRLKFNRVYLHLFTDGRDAPPRDGINILREVQEKINFMKLGQVVTVCGRYFAMDRDGRWARIQKAYEAMVLGKAKRYKDPITAIEDSYNQGKTDEFVEPFIVENEHSKPKFVSDNDSVIFFNFRVDRARELSMALVFEDFERLDLSRFGFEKKPVEPDSVTTFKREKVPKNLHFVTMTEYQKNIPVSGIIFPPQKKFPDSVVEVLSKMGYRQMHIAESEKERMVTYYFRGMNSKPYPGEESVIIPSPKVPTYDQYPEMSAGKITDTLIRYIRKDIYHFFLINFANPDMVAHSGNIEATVKAVEYVDRCMAKIVKEVLAADGTILISADHGNAEELLTFESKSFFYTTDNGVVNTDHSFNPVPVIIANKSLEGHSHVLLEGTLADIAPTILDIMNIQKPSVMTGKNLLDAKNTNQ